MSHQTRPRPARQVEGGHGFPLRRVRVRGHRLVGLDPKLNDRFSFSLLCSSTMAPEKKKSKSFKRIRGLLSREKKKPKAAAAPAEAPASVADDQSTVYGVDVDDRSIATSSVAAPPSSSLLETASKPKESTLSAPKPFLLKVVLLLMDAQTRRFELLQLEFDSIKALVSDVLAQIPISVTEASLKSQAYTGICGRDGKEMTAAVLLKSFCKGNDVLVAVPSGMSAKECAKLAKPILSDDKVVNMLKASGVDVSDWARAKKKPSISHKKKSTPAPTSTDKSIEIPEESSSSFAPKLFGILVLLALAFFLNVVHVYLSTPIRPGHVIAPGLWLSECGLLPTCRVLNVQTDGTVVLYQDMERVWEFQGAPGDLEFGSDKILKVGGERIHWVTLHDDSAVLDPWPFEEKPKIRTKRA